MHITRVFISAHSPDNSFLGFAVPQRGQENKSRPKTPKPRKAALVYGKDPHFWMVRIEYNNVSIIQL